MRHEFQSASKSSLSRKQTSLVATTGKPFQKPVQQLHEDKFPHQYDLYGSVLDNNYQENEFDNTQGIARLKLDYYEAGTYPIPILPPESNKSPSL